MKSLSKGDGMKESILITTTESKETLTTIFNAFQLQMHLAETEFGEKVKPVLDQFSKELRHKLGPVWDDLEKYLRENQLMPLKYDTGNYVLRVDPSGAIYMETKNTEEHKMRRLLESLS
jgi:hypothetical protein